MIIKNQKNLFVLLAVAAAISIMSGCGADDTVEEVKNANYLSGVFLDSPVEGLTFISGDTTGYTDSNGTFVYAEGSTEIEFKIGGLSLGKVTPGEQITPLDFGGSDATVNTEIVKNLAALLQSLDNDGDASNGIVIETEVTDASGIESIDISSENFVDDLSTLVTSINSELSLSLTFIHPNNAIQHLASSLGLDDQLGLLPTVKLGRKWDNGFYFPYNSGGHDDPNREYILNVMDDSVVYNFGNGSAYLLNIEYSGDTLYGFGNIYNNINEEPSSPYEFRNRYASPGFSINHNDTVFFSYYSFRKKSGNEGEIIGEYTSFLQLDCKLQGQEAFQVISFHQNLSISESNNIDSLKLTLTDLREDSYSVENFLIHKNKVKNQHLFLVMFDNSEYLFADRTNGFYPGLLGYQK